MAYIIYIYIYIYIDMYCIIILRVNPGIDGAEFICTADVSTTRGEEECPCYLQAQTTFCRS